MALVRLYDVAKEEKGREPSLIPAFRGTAKHLNPTEIAQRTHP